MKAKDMRSYDGYPEPAMIARAHLAETERVRHEREQAEKRQVHELEEIVLRQPNDFAD